MAKKGKKTKSKLAAPVSALSEKAEGEAENIRLEKISSQIESAVNAQLAKDGKESKKKKSKPVASLSARASPAACRAAQAGTEDLLRESAAAIHNIRSGIRKLTTEGAIEIGRLLSVVKEKVSYGDWLRWLKEEFDWTDRSARNFMSVFKMTQRANKLEIISNLSISPTALYLLAAPRTPDKVRDAVLARAEAGEKVSVAEVREAIQSADPEMDAILAKRAEHTVSSEPQTVAAADTQRRVNPRGKYVAFLNLLAPDDFRIELLNLCRAVAELDRGWAISMVESPRMISVETVQGGGSVH